ncbi:hypothetical protein L7F22_041676 [Adiantum nelumboides]|nr:hypothetical protein [Adiantum nelumboides]
MKDLKDWKQGKSKVMYWLSMSASNSMMGYLESAPSLVIAWKSLEKLNEHHTRVKKLQLKTELNIVKRGNISTKDYASKIKTITYSLGSIGVAIDGNDVVAATLEGLGTKYKNFKSSMNTRVDVLKRRVLVLVHHLLKEISVLINKPSIQIEAEAEVVAQVVVVVVNIKIDSKIKVKVVKEEGKIIEARGEVETKMQTEIKIMHLMLNVGYEVSGVTTQMNFQQHEGGQIIAVR